MKKKKPKSLTQFRFDVRQCSGSMQQISADSLLNSHIYLIAFSSVFFSVDNTEHEQQMESAEKKGTLNISHTHRNVRNTMMCFFNIFQQKECLPRRAYLKPEAFWLFGTAHLSRDNDVCCVCVRLYLCHVFFCCWVLSRNVYNV